MILNTSHRSNHDPWDSMGPPSPLVTRWDSRLELLTRYSAQLKGPRHADFMGQVGDHR